MLDVKRLDKYTDKLERQFQAELAMQYKNAKVAIEKELAYAYAKWGTGDTLTMAEVQKYDRLTKLLNAVNDDLATLNRGKNAQVRGYLTDVYLANYYNFANLIEKGADIGIGFGLLNRNAIYQSVLTPMDLIALEENAHNVRVGVKRAITQGIVQGQGVREMAKAVTVALESNANDATRIVRTETTGIMNKARLDASERAETEGIKLLKVWVATNDDRTRDRHAEINGEERPLDKPYSNGLMYPGDQSGPASEVIQCRCAQSTEIVVVADSMKDRPLLEIPKEYRI
jgi:SPP1 gp7 family putative phage head morphogenesis protein